MSVENVTDGSARVLATVDGMKAAYGSTAGGMGDTVKAIPSDVGATPIAIVTYDHFELAPGQFETTVHYVNADLWLNAANVAEMEKVLLPLVSRCIAAFRTKVGLYITDPTTNIIATVPRGGPGRSEQVGTKKFYVFPLSVRVQEFSIQTYSTS